MQCLFFRSNLQKKFATKEMLTIFAIPNGKNGVIAQLVEQRTENPCVPGSIPGDTTSEKESYRNVTLFFFSIIIYILR